MKILAQNNQARFDYEILEKFEAGIQLEGFEVKSVKAGQISLKGAFAVFHDDNLFLLNSNIPAWQPKNAPTGYDPARSRKLLLRKKELVYLLGKSKEARISLIPLAVILNNNWIKVEIGVGRGKKLIDKREVIKKREVNREIDRNIKSY